MPIKYVGFHNYNCNNEWKRVLLLYNALLYSSQWFVSGLIPLDSSSDLNLSADYSLLSVLQLLPHTKKDGPQLSQLTARSKKSLFS